MRPIDIGLADLETVRRILREHTPRLEVRAFGSRVSWTARATSDLDLTLMTAEPLNIARMAKLKAAFTASDLPFRVDIVDWASASESFRKVIERDHVVLAAVSGDTFKERHSREASEWHETTLGCLLSFSNGKSSPERIDGLPHPVYGSNGIIGFSNETNTASNTTVIGRVGAYCGSLHYSDRNCWVTDNAIRANAIDGSNAKFLLYLLQTLRLNDWRAGSGQPLLNQNILSSIPVVVPPLPEQRAIGHILGTLDDKIELNRRMNETLEALARALFTSWFVTFDPVRAKMARRDPGLPKYIADLFPDRFVESEVGEIPEGWEVEILSDHFEAVKGVSYKGSGLSDSGVPLHNLNSVHEGGGYKYEGIKFYSGEYADRHVVRPGDVIVANTEQGHHRLLIGYAAIVPGFFGDFGIASHHIYCLKPKPNSQLSTVFLCSLLNSLQMHDLVSGYANGTTVNMLPFDAVQKPLIVIPPRALVEAFSVLAVYSEHRSEETVSESRTLSALRDTLLPKLVSGEVRVNVADRRIEEAM